MSKNKNIHCPIPKTLNMNSEKLFHSFNHLSLESILIYTQTSAMVLLLNESDYIMPYNSRADVVRQLAE